MIGVIQTSMTEASKSIGITKRIKIFKLFVNDCLKSGAGFSKRRFKKIFPSLIPRAQLRITAESSNIPCGSNAAII
jgi:hypothetical protein